MAGSSPVAPVLSEEFEHDAVGFGFGVGDERAGHGVGVVGEDRDLDATGASKCAGVVGQPVLRKGNDRCVARRKSPARISSHPHVGVAERQCEAFTRVRSLLRRFGKNDRDVAELLSSEQA